MFCSCEKFTESNQKGIRINIDKINLLIDHNLKKWGTKF